jgi:hypothetical protein
MLVVFVKPLYRVQPKCLFMYARHYYAHSQTYNYTQLLKHFLHSIRVPRDMDITKTHLERVRPLPRYCEIEEDYLSLNPSPTLTWTSHSLCGTTAATNHPEL